MYDGYVIPGARARDYLLDNYADAGSKHIIYLPNVVNEEIYHTLAQQLREEKSEILESYGVQYHSDTRVLFTAVRLAPIKGVIELLGGIASLDEADRRKLVLLIAGDGEQRDEIERYISQNQLPNVKLLGHRGESEIVKLFASADGFILPSIRDPSPLAAIEAAFAGLPLLLSENAGNSPELLSDGHNGWLFNPSNPMDVCNVLEMFLSTPRNRLSDMGSVSTRIAQDKFDSTSSCAPIRERDNGIMRVLFATIGYIPAVAWGGPVRVVHEQAREMARRGYEVSICASN